MKVLFIISKGMEKLSDETIRQLEKENKKPRDLLLEDEINAQILDERYLLTVPLIRRMIYKLLPVYVRQIIEAYIIHNRYDAVLSYYERVGLPFAYLQKIFGSKTPHTLMTSWLSANQKVWFLKRVHKTLSKIIVWSSVQYNFAVDEIGIPPEKLHLIKYGTDQKFWKPEKMDTVMISSAGMEMRDYPTLIEALRMISIRCHIATGLSRGQLFDTVKKLYKIDNLPQNVTVGRKTYTELKEMYAKSRFVVVPLLPTDTDNGLTVILESMAMGKPVICSKVEGQVDLIQDGVTGIYVKQGDPEALKEAIVDLWNNPEKVERMGKAARKFIEDVHNLEQFVASIKAAVDTRVDDTDGAQPVPQVSGKII